VSYRTFFFTNRVVGPDQFSPPRGQISLELTDGAESLELAEVLPYATSTRDSFGLQTSDDPYLPHGRLVLDDDGSSRGAVAAVNYVSYPSYPTGHSDGALSPKLGYSVDSGHPDSPDPNLPCDLTSDHTVYGYTATLFPEYFDNHMNKQDSVLGSPPSFDHDAAQAIGPYTPQGQGLTNGVMSIVGAGEPSEKILCIYGGCTKTFTRTADLDRHALNVHNRVGHHCQVPGCINNKGKGYCRADKLKDHMWKKHGRVADLSYTKAMPFSCNRFE
jgi:hypothetical protein